MMRTIALCLSVGILIASFVRPAYCWNDTGHMVIARLAWLKLSPKERAKASAILKKHPHYQEFLKAGKPPNVDLDEWVFLKAATWADWVKFYHTADYNHPNWHFIDLPYVLPGSHATARPVPKENAIQTLKTLSDAFATAKEDDAAIPLCWVLHVIGDIHQPLHCVTMFSEGFPEGDRGGNRCLVMMGNRKVQLHRFFDGLLGASTKPSAIFGLADEIETVAQRNRDVIAADLACHATFDSWAKEGFANAKEFAYLNGALEPANSDRDPKDEDIPQVPRDYQTNAGELARMCSAKAGERLAKTLHGLLD